MNLLYEGKAKKIYQAENDNEIIVYYKDDATAFNGIKKAQITSKGELNNAISTLIFTYLTEHNIPNHFIKQLSIREQLCKKVDIIPLEVIVRNIVAGSLAKRLQIEEGTKIEHPVYEICYKNDELGDPLINDHHAVMLKLATYQELNHIYQLTQEINQLLISFFKRVGIILVDFKIEFGKDHLGNIILADEVSPDTCRLWDEKTHEKLDKDRFRRDLGSIKEAYEEIFNRIKS
ncbi:MAG: phosphoribosylaminoimidazolesuccinocarboxamide synthase [Acholeplasmataceae bacterium]|jgi:phosphoribosylaminoimidazole-succinocarboxamide synthase|nr:phosphoribosylaminoimidazolesuccinocarboxamide synthase [Acholeplasmataceae bacterium]